MPDPSVDLASLLCSRLCHDLLSPIGAMNNGLELLAGEEDPAMREQVMQLLADSARASADRLKFYRLAFGASSGSDAIDANELKSAIEGLVRANRRLTLGWLVDQPAIGKTAAKILLNLTMVAADALVRGGRLDVAAEGGEVVIRAEGPRLVLDREIRAVLAGEADRSAIGSRSVAAWLTRQLAEEAHGAISVADQEEGVLLLAATLP